MSGKDLQIMKKIFTTTLIVISVLILAQNKVFGTEANYLRPQSHNERNKTVPINPALRFYLSSPLLRQHEPKTIPDTLKYLNDNRARLGDNSLGYLVQALAVAGKLPPTLSTQTWIFKAGAFDRAIHEEKVITDEIIRIWREQPAVVTYRSDLARLCAFFNPAILPNLRTRRPLSAAYRNIILDFAYELYGKRLIMRLKGETREWTMLIGRAI